MELKQNIQRTAEEINQMANDAIAMIKEINNGDIMCIFYDSPKSNAPHYQDVKIDCYESEYGTKESVFIPQDVMPCVIAKFKEMGYFVWQNSDYRSRNTYWITRHNIQPHSRFRQV